MTKLLFPWTLCVLLPSLTTSFARWGPRLPQSRRVSMSASTEEISTDESIKTADLLSLDSIRSTLIRQEETIIFALIERSQFRKNQICYERGGFGSLGVPPGSIEAEGPELSFMEYMLVGTEALHGTVGRYRSPEEHPFFPERIRKEQMEELPLLSYPSDLLSNENGASDINFNKLLLRTYIDDIVPMIAKPGYDEQHGSTALTDIAALQALSRRIHYGKFVAESKYRSDPEGYQRLVDAGDSDGVMKLLTNEEVEKKVLQRAKMKAATYGMEPLVTELPPIECSDTTNVVAAAAASAVVAALEAVGNEKAKPGKIDPHYIESVYRDIIIPMTKQVEVAYLFRRCGRDPPPEYIP